MSLERKDRQRFSYADYLTWPDQERWELIDGRAYNMTPAPSFRHQRVVGNLYFLLRSALEGSPCVAGIAPTDIVLSDYDVVQPDVFVVCDERKLTEQNIKGAPDLVIEVTSPATALKDRREKKNLYQQYAVKEYVVIEPEAQYAERFLLEENGLYGKSEILGPQETLTLASLQGIKINLSEALEAKVPEEE